MVICPWCGTSYAVFQSNCQRCGGPLMATDQVAAREAGPSAAGETDQSVAAPPPPAPRPISDSYIWRLMSGEGWVVAALVFTLIGGIFFVVGAMLTLFIITAFVGIPFALLGLLFLGGGVGVGVWRYQAARQTVEVMRTGEAATGQIARVEQNLSVRVNGRHPWTITYQFQVLGRPYEGQVTTLNPPGLGLRSGKMAYVLYSPNAPERNALYPHP